MKMLNITLSFFILLLFANVKGATFQSANHSSPKLIAYNPITQPTATFTDHKERDTPYLDAINDAFRDESEKTKYAFQGGNYHWVITDFDISIDNDCRSVKKYFSKNEIETIQAGTVFFIAYVKEKFKDVVSRYMYKYDFESNYPTDLMDFSHKLKTSVYDRFEYELTHCLIKYEKEPKDEKLKKRAKKFFEALIQNSDMKMKGHFIKIIWDNDNKCLTHNVSLYFNININKNNANATYNFVFPKHEIVESFVKPLRKRNLLSQVC
ncbi:fam-d protein [Plasmodium vinckei lentum]|uniref:Fam-d protein n=1 Tax=Plasmodium vinckei lentum TaxID=138297 RepID=A0A6V7S4J8_PLAVN|nr:fam-d protein [Plasmodium vinckei lentum]